MPEQVEREKDARPRLPARATTAARAVAWAVFGGLAASFLPLPWGLAAGAFYLAAAVAACVAIGHLTGLGPAVRGHVVFLVAGLVLSLVMVMGVLVLVAFYPIVAEAQECARSAVTVSGRAGCEDLVRERFAELLPAPPAR